MKKIVVLSDTHNTLDKHFINYFKKADEIWHAGDIGSIEIIDELKKYAPVKAVWGNIDNNIIRREFSQDLLFKTENVRIMMTHIGGYDKKHHKRILNLIEKYQPNIFVSGHSHILKVIYDKKYNLLRMNPGSIGDVGIHKVKTILCFNINGENIKDLNVIEIPRKNT